MKKYLVLAALAVTAVAYGNIESVLLTGSNTTMVDSISMRSGLGSVTVATAGFGGAPSVWDTFRFNSSVNWPDQGVTIYYKLDGNPKDPFTIREVQEDLFYELPAFLDGPPKIKFYNSTGLTGVRGTVASVRVSTSPNPMRSETEVRCALRSAGCAAIEVYDGTGQLVRTLASGALGEGEHRFAWTRRDEFGRRVGSGIYFVRARTEGGLSLSKLVVTD